MDWYLWHVMSIEEVVGIITSNCRSLNHTGTQAPGPRHPQSGNGHAMGANEKVFEKISMQPVFAAESLTLD